MSLLEVYNTAFNKARQRGGGGNERSTQSAHLLALEEVSRTGGSPQDNAPQENPGEALKRRQALCAHWLGQEGRRTKYSAKMTFQSLIEAFVAGATYERKGEKLAEEAIQHDVEYVEELEMRTDMRVRTAEMYSSLDRARVELLESVIDKLVATVKADSMEDLQEKVEKMFAEGTPETPA